MVRTKNGFDRDEHDNQQKKRVINQEEERGEEENDDGEEEEEVRFDHFEDEGCNEPDENDDDDIVDDDDDNDESGDDEEEFDADKTHEERQASTKKIEQDVKGNKPRKIHKLSLTVTEDFNETLRKRGVLYVARIPPRMTPTKIKSLLSEFGVVTRVYLVEEDATVRKRRRKVGGSGSKRYVEGWVEMEDKQVAKRVAASLNNTPISNYKRSIFYDNLWNLKYLHKFKWSHLTEKVAYERRVREQKLRVEMMQARRENAAYAQLVETGQKIDKIEARLERKRQREQQTKGGRSAADDNKGPSLSTNEGPFQQKKRSRSYPQEQPLDEKSKVAAKHAVLKSLL